MYNVNSHILFTLVDQSSMGSTLISAKNSQISGSKEDLVLDSLKAGLIIDL